MVISFLKKESSHFSKHISGNVRRLVGSNALKTISNPLFSTFLNAFVWRLTGSIYSVALYNLGMCIALPIGFYLNGLLLRRFHIEKLFAVGAILSGVTSAAFVVTGSANSLSIFFYGFIWGLGNGLYWANRNFLEFQETELEGRQYFFGFNSAVGALSNILVPLLVGWFIVFGTYTGWYTTTHAYWILFAFALLIMVFCGVVIYSGTFITPQPKKIFFPGNRKNRSRRILSMATGLMDGLAFLPTLLVLTVFGNEGVLGTAASIVSLLSVIALYVYGRSVHVRHSIKTATILSFVFFLSSLLLIVVPAKLNYVLYTVLSGGSIAFFSLVVSPVFLELSEKEMEGDQTLRFAYVFDNELYLNLGRVLGICAVLFLALKTASHTTLILAPSIIAGLQLIFFMWFLYARKSNTYAN